MISDSVLEWETQDCVLHSAEMGAKVDGPINAAKHPLVDFDSRVSPAKSASENTAK